MRNKHLQQNLQVQNKADIPPVVQVSEVPCSLASTTGGGANRLNMNAAKIRRKKRISH